MYIGCRLQVLTTHNMGDTLQGIINHTGHMIARAIVFARQDNITPPGGVDPVPCFVATGVERCKLNLANALTIQRHTDRLSHVEAQRKTLT